MWTWKPTWFAALVLLVGCGDDDPAAPPTPPVPTAVPDAPPAATLPPTADLRAIVFARDGSLTAYEYRIPEEKSNYVVLQGKTYGPYAGVGKFEHDRERKTVAVIVVSDSGRSVLTATETWGPYDEVTGLKVSRDGRRVAFVAGRQGKQRVVVDGSEGPPFDRVDHFGFSEDGRRVAYAGVTAGSGVVVVDGVPGEAFDRVGAPAFRPDGSTIVYNAEKGGAAFVVDGAARGPAFDEVKWELSTRAGGRSTVRAYFTQDGTTPCYVARRGKRWSVVEGDRVGEPFDEIRNLTMPADGRSTAYEARLDRAWFVVVRDEKGPECAWVTSTQFSPDGSRLAYVATDGGRKFCVVDGERQGPYANLGSFAFSPDGTRIAYPAQRELGGPWAVVVDGKAGPEFPAIGEIVFSSSGIVAYAATDPQGKGALVVGDRVESLDGVCSGIAFSKDGTRIAYLFQQNGKTRVVADGRPGEEYDFVAYATFDGSNSTVWYLANNGGTRPEPAQWPSGGAWHFVVGDRKGPPMEKPLISWATVNEARTELRYPYRRGGEILVHSEPWSD